jgi:hypothetical protein
MLKGLQWNIELGTRYTKRFQENVIFFYISRCRYVDVYRLSKNVGSLLSSMSRCWASERDVGRDVRATFSSSSVADSTTPTVLRLCNVGWYDDWRMMILKECGRKRSWPNRGTIQAFTWRVSGKPRKSLIKIGCVSAEIRMECSPNLEEWKFHTTQSINPDYAIFMCRVKMKIDPLFANGSHFSRHRLSPSVLTAFRVRSFYVVDWFLIRWAFLRRRLWLGMVLSQSSSCATDLVTTVRNVSSYHRYEYISSLLLRQRKTDIYFSYFVG